MGKFLFLLAAMVVLGLAWSAGESVLRRRAFRRRVAVETTPGKRIAIVAATATSTYEPVRLAALEERTNILAELRSLAASDLGQLVPLLSDADASVREAVLEAIRDTSTLEAARALLEVVVGDGALQEPAAQALGTMGIPAREVILKHLDEINHVCDESTHLLIDALVTSGMAAADPRLALKHDWSDYGTMCHCVRCLVSDPTRHVWHNALEDGHAYEKRSDGHTCVFCHVAAPHEFSRMEGRYDTIHWTCVICGYEQSNPPDKT